MSKKLKDFMVEEIYKLVEGRDIALYDMFKVLDKNSVYCSSPYGMEVNNLLLDFSKKLNLELNDELKLSLLNRLILLREDDLLKTFDLLKFDDEKQIELRKIAYDFTEEFQMGIQKNLLDSIINLKIPKFYKKLLKGVFNIGLSMNSLNKVWDDTLLNKVNKDLEQELEIDRKINVIDFLKEKNLLEFDSRTNGFADRSYSILRKTSNENEEPNYVIEPYAVAFKKEVENVVNEITNLINKLNNVLLKQMTSKKSIIKDYTNWVNYFISLRDAFEETNPKLLIEKWAKIDTQWMKIDSPLQIGHPLEYYEDKYRSAVCIEFDVRIDNISLSKLNKRVDSCSNMFNTIFDELTNLDNKNNLDNDTINSIHKATNKNLKKTQVHIGKQVFYFGASLNGLSSAQVVPNDEIVSENDGKKIFAFAEKAISLNRAKPHLLINKKVFGYDFMNQYYSLLHNRPEDFLTVYDITTIGHEYGHILFKNENSEIKMNDDGTYKNIEEFKASAGGLVSYFLDFEDSLKGDKPEIYNLWQDVFNNTIMRAVNLIGWKKQKEIEAYYCEGLITLEILFNSKVLVFDVKTNKLHIHNDITHFNCFVRNYKEVYKDLATTYLKQENSINFLNKFCKKYDDGFMYPLDKKVFNFVNYFYDLIINEGKVLDTDYMDILKEKVIKK